MRLEFRVLWFENQPRDVRTQIEEIEEYVKEVGFIPKIDMQLDASKIAELSQQQSLYDDFDLVVVDYDLGKPGMNGDEVARLVRKGFGFTDIIFYSGKPTVDLRDLVHKSQIDGVYCLSRPELANRLGDHIDQAVKRLSRLEAMRGLAMGTVGKCDDELRALLATVYEAAPQERRDKLRAELDEIVASGANRAREQYAMCATFSERLSSRAVTSFHLQKLTLAVTGGQSIWTAQRKVLGQYDKEVLQPRNTLGHATETRGHQGWQVESSTNPAITSSDFPKLRQNMAVHLDNICSFRPLLPAEGIK